MSTLTRNNVALLHSDRSRRAGAEVAVRRGDVYAFTGAGGRTRTWLKGEHAYLGPSALSNVLLRWGITHDVISDEEVTTTLASYDALFLSGAAHLSQSEIVAVGRWLSQPERFLIVSGHTNLPLEMLGVASFRPFTPDGYTAWQWAESAPIGHPDHRGGLTISSYRGYTCSAATAAPGAAVFAGLVEVTGDLSSAEAATVSPIGDGIIATERTLFIANQPFEFLGGVLQAHLNVEDVRGWETPTHWGDALVLRLRAALQRTPARRLWASTLRPFGSYDGVLQLRHDVDHSDDQAIDLSMLEVETANAVPASYYVMDPAFCKTRCTTMGGKIWTEALSRFNFMEVGQHNDSVEGDPPTALVGTGLADHIEASDLTMGTASVTAGRHMGFLCYPETIDAMEHLYDRNPALLGLCTFSLYDVIEYGVRNPEVVVHGKQITYTTYDHGRPERPAAISGYWFPYHVVVSTAEGQRTLRGWDVTHDTDCNFQRLETIMDGYVGRDGERPDRLENGVFTIQYETQLAQAPFENGGRGHLPWLRYAIAYAERKNYWITTKARLYRRMNDYEAVVLRRDGTRSWTLRNPTDRTMRGLVMRIEQPPEAITAGGRTMLHVVDGRFFLLPPLPPGSVLALAGVDDWRGPRISQPNTRFVEIAEAWLDDESNRVHIEGELIRSGYLVVERLPPATAMTVGVRDNRGATTTRLSSNDCGEMAIPLFGQRDNLIPFAVDYTLGDGRSPGTRRLP